jgi:hypothetical protein
MATLKITNTTVPAVSIDDVGVIIPAGIGSFDSFTDPRLIRDLSMSANLRTLVGAGTLTLSDGTNALVVDDLAAYWSAGGQTLPKGTTPVSSGPGYKSQPPGSDGSALVFDSNQVSGVISYILPFGLGANRVRWWAIQQNGGLTTLNQIGFTTAPTVTGTAALLSLTIGQFIQYTSGIVINNDAGWLSSAFSQTQFNYRPRWAVAMRVGTPITLCRYWLGLFSATPMASADPAVHAMGFRYSTDVDGTAFWRCYTNDGAGTGTVTVTTVPIVANTVYKLRMEVDPAGANVKFYIDGVLVATHTTDLPAAAQNLGHVEQVRTLDASAKIISISKVQLEQVAA